jgi:photosystem II stability/assembly factor-like uncharacterized protein
VQRGAPAFVYASVASSASGQFLVAGVYGSASASGSSIDLNAAQSSVFISADYGATWAARAMPGNSPGTQGVAISQDGTRLFSASVNGGVYASVDSGATWTERSPQVQATYWGAIVCSPNGLLVAATTYVDVYGGSAALAKVYVSSDGGLTWVNRTPQGLANFGWWGLVAQSADGQRIIVGNNQGVVLTSGNAGVNWMTRTVPGFNSEDNLALASSADGSLFVAAFPANGAGKILTSP